MKLRSHLLLLVVAAVLPVVIFAGAMTYESYRQQRTSTERGLIDTARALSAALDREFLGSIQALKVLASSEALAHGDLRDFQDEMRKAQAAYGPTWQNIALLDRTGQQLINLRLPFGAPLPRTDPVRIKRDLDTRAPNISNVFLGPVTGVPSAVVSVPVLQNGEVKYVLRSGFPLARLLDLLSAQKLPPSWTITIIDRNARIAARSRNVEKFLGKPASSSLIVQAKRNPEGAERGATLDRVTVVGAHKRSDFSGWTVALGVPVAEIDAPLRKLLLLAGFGGLALLVAALALALALGRRIAQPVSALTEAVEKLGRGETPEIPRLQIAEINRLARGLETAATQRTQAEEQVRRSERSLRDILDGLCPQMFVGLLTPDGILIQANRPALAAARLAPEDVLGKPFEETYWWSYSAPVQRQLRAAIERAARGEPARYDTENRVADNRFIAIDFALQPLHDETGKIAFLVPSAVDITERKRAEEALRSARDQLEEKVHERTRELAEANAQLRDLDRLKSQFLANMSHELRTPLNAIVGFSQLMHDGKVGPISAEHKEYLGDILSSGQHLLQLINDILDLSKVDAGRMEVLNTAFPLADLIVEATQNLAPIMSVKGLKLIREIPDDLPPIISDRRKLFQILLNLASNAVKFTERGEIRLRCHVAGGTLRLAVSDTGIGIKESDIKLLFQPFSQLDTVLQRRPEGTGLGLHLSQKLAGLLGGAITVESEYGKGSTFTLALPLTPERQKELTN